MWCQSAQYTINICTGRTDRHKISFSKNFFLCPGEIRATGHKRIIQAQTATCSRFTPARSSLARIHVILALCAHFPPDPLYSFTSEEACASGLTSKLSSDDGLATSAVADVMPALPALSKTSDTSAISNPGASVSSPFNSPFA